MDTEANRGEEYLAFVQDARPAIQYRNTYEENTKTSCCCGRKCCCCKISWKCCAIVTVAIIGAIGVLVLAGTLYIRSKLTGTATSENSEEWEKFLTAGGNETAKMSENDDIFVGEYKLVSYDENYSSYLKAMGVPFFVVPLILGSSETVRVARKSDGKLHFQILTDDVMKNEFEFKMDEPFETEWGRKSGIMSVICTQPMPHILNCTSEEKEKGWNFVSESVFSQGGYINTRTFLTKNISTKKYYQRQGSVTDESFGLDGVDVVTLAPETDLEDSPFSDDADDGSYEDFGDEWFEK